MQAMRGPCGESHVLLCMWKLQVATDREMAEHVRRISQSPSRPQLCPRKGSYVLVKRVTHWFGSAAVRVVHSHL